MQRKHAFRPPIHDSVSDHWPAMQTTGKWCNNTKNRISIKMNHRQILYIITCQLDANLCVNMILLKK
jgi:hypothetical protein